MDPGIDPRENRRHGSLLLIALALPLVWFFSFNRLYPHFLVDESGHLFTVHHILEGKSGWPKELTMLPGYHLVVASLWQLHPTLSLLTVARLVASAMGVLALLGFACAWRRVHGTHPGRMTLLLALLPILQPFTGLAYTDLPALAVVMIAFTAQLAGHYATSALLFAAAALLRQTNLLWAAFAIAYECVQPGLARPELFRRTRWNLLLIASAAITVVALGRVAVGTDTGTSIHPNIATLHTAAILALLFGLPLWAALLPAELRACRSAFRSHPFQAILFSFAAVVAVVALTRTYANPHPWNRDLFWSGHPFTLVRNWPLVGMERHLSLRVASAVNIVLMTAVVVAGCARQPRRKALWLAFLAGALLPFANSLVEPRYFIPGVVFLLLFADISRRHQQLLTGWWALLCAAHAPFIATGRALW